LPVVAGYDLYAAHKRRLKLRHTFLGRKLHFKIHRGIRPSTFYAFAGMKSRVVEGDQGIPASGASGTAAPVFRNCRNNLEIMSARFARVFIDRHGNLLSGEAGNQCCENK
jgi:hypothetical protein